jgi:HD-like signal output (HDOD) protein
MTISLDLKQSLSIQPIDLPVFHPVALDLMLIISDPYSDIDDIIRVINEDQGLTAQVLKMANSSA